MGVTRSFRHGHRRTRAIPDSRFPAKKSRFSAGWALLCAASFAAALPTVSASSAHAAEDEKPSQGRPEVVLDRLDFPRDLIGAQTFEKHLKRTLRREGRRVDWGAGRENRIEYRFTVTTLRFEVQDDLLRVHCTAVGKLPSGRTAKSQISFGGAPSERSSLVKDVLDIVARGVMTRLAELERQRRGLR